LIGENKKGGGGEGGGGEKEEKVRIWGRCRIRRSSKKSKAIWNTTSAQSTSLEITGKRKKGLREGRERVRQRGEDKRVAVGRRQTDQARISNKAYSDATLYIF